MDFIKYEGAIFIQDPFRRLKRPLSHSLFVLCVVGVLLCFHIIFNYYPANQVAVSPTTIHEIIILQESQHPPPLPSRRSSSDNSRRQSLSCATILYSYCSYFSEPSPDNTFSYMEIRNGLKETQRLVPRHYRFYYWEGRRFSRLLSFLSGWPDLGLIHARWLEQERLRPQLCEDKKVELPPWRYVATFYLDISDVRKSRRRHKVFSLYLLLTSHRVLPYMSRLGVFKA